MELVLPILQQVNTLAYSFIWRVYCIDLGGDEMGGGGQYHHCFHAVSSTFYLDRAYCSFALPRLVLQPLVPNWTFVSIAFGSMGMVRLQSGENRREGGAVARELTVMTYNRGQNMNQSLQPFKNAIKPDLIVFQDAAGRADGFLRSPEYSEFGHGESVGEFTLISRYPIKEGKLLPGPAPSNSNTSARFVIEWNKQLVSIYAVHLRTPRDVLRSYMRGAFLWGLVGLPGTPWAEKRLHYQQFWDKQMADSQRVLNAVLADGNPSIVAGDFNAAHTGRIHQMMIDHLGDAHMAVGNGFGFTFPGVTRNPLSLGGPWLRIDYVFYDSHWRAIECVTERDRPSQHRALAARLILIDK